MSYDEYNDLYRNAQASDTKYIAFVLDIKESKKMDSEERYNAQIKSFETFNLLIKTINYLEKKNNIKILVDDFPVQRVKQITEINNNGFAYLNNPCVVFGDSFGFYCYNNTINSKQFKAIFSSCAKICNNQTKYHFKSAKFETLKYEDGAKKYYLGYAIEKLCKDKNNEEVNSF